MGCHGNTLRYTARMTPTVCTCFAQLFNWNRLCCVSRLKRIGNLSVSFISQSLRSTYNCCWTSATMITACKTRSGTPGDRSWEIIPLVIPYSFLFTQRPAHEDCFGGFQSQWLLPNTCVLAETIFYFIFFKTQTLLGFNVQSLSFSQQRQLGFCKNKNKKRLEFQSTKTVGFQFTKTAWVSPKKHGF